MATPHPPSVPVSSETLITVKVIIEGTNRRFKLALRDLGAHTLPQKLRFLLNIPSDADVKFERYSDSAGTYVLLDSNDPAIYKQLYRAAKAKLKLRLRATVERSTKAEALSEYTTAAEAFKIQHAMKMAENNQPEARQSFLETVLSSPKVTTDENTAVHAQTTDNPVCMAYVNRVNEHKKPLVFLPAAKAASTHIQSPTLNDLTTQAFGIDCNHCNQSVVNEHYHCGICENGDFDVCQNCIDLGLNCHGDDHWLIKRVIQNGMVTPSVTEKLPPRKLQSPKSDKASAKDHTLTTEQNTSQFPPTGMIGCNCCITEMLPQNFVTCKTCFDYDLCFSCFQSGNHGHHPAHVFEPVDRDAEELNAEIHLLCGAGRGVQHEAACDGCDKSIVGVRHKCLSCPDWDFCSACIGEASTTHPGHRFAPLYEPLEFIPMRKEVHRGIYCDGPLCAARSHKIYIRGDRYKCTVCHDTDFCSNCESIPSLEHNKTHPLIKMKTSVRHISISTFNEFENDQESIQLGDRPLAKHAATETIPATSTNAATQVQTVAEVKPAESVTPDYLTPKDRDVEKSKATTPELQAWYESDSTPDGSTFGPSRLVSQSWTLRNPGPTAWPVGCAVHYIGGDDMRNLDALHPSSTSSMTVANRSNSLYYSLQPGQTAVFTVLLKSPPREGRAISYWRLKTPDGLPFGHKLWVDINVKTSSINSPIAPAVSPVIPDSVETKSKEEKATTPTIQGSTMIFPKLDKESPVSSTHDISATSDAIASPTPEDEDHDLFEDVEGLALEEDEESDEDGFMTDEEYDILDASDEDFLNEAQQAAAPK